MGLIWSKCRPTNHCKYNLCWNIPCSFFTGLIFFEIMVDWSFIRLSVHYNDHFIAFDFVSLYVAVNLPCISLQFLLKHLQLFFQHFYSTIVLSIQHLNDLLPLRFDFKLCLVKFFRLENEDHFFDRKFHVFTELILEQL